MLSRTAENIYWFGRYLQRAENTARLVNVQAQLSLDLPPRVPLSWGSLIEILSAGPDFAARGEQPGESEVARFLVADERFGGSIRRTLGMARENLRSTRETLPSESWEKLNELYALVEARGESAAYRRIRNDLLRKVIEDCLTIVGMLISNMSRGTAFQFLRLGMALEQADMTTRIVDARSGGMVADGETDELAPFRAVQWMSVLKSLHAYQMYRRQQRTRVTGPRALAFLLHDPTFPRSVSFCLWSMQQTLPRLPEHAGLRQALDEAVQLVASADVRALLSDDQPNSLGDMLDAIQITLGAVHNAIDASFFQPPEEVVRETS
ncbi:alpha-E domain-containing protein [Algiphilus aromaticivorans]|uniref:alpha-E domain-containing protein n=1 Tax=Algiphilus aromaticivorans TaxID=382454 RepID=UPI0005C1D275|nr:alpha-E domain-containing protein [Algiphilus aromaticivorans]